MKDIKTLKKKAKRCLDRLEIEYPQAGTRLNYENRFQLLAAVILSAQTTDNQVNNVTPSLFALYPDPATMAAAELADLERAIRGVGLYKNKARFLQGMSRMICEQHNGEVPGVYEDLLALPGVGSKSANVVLAVGFDLPGLGVDTHVHRVANRLGLTDTKQPQQTEKALKELIPPGRWSRAHHLLINHGRQICKARKPACGECFLQGDCRHFLMQN